MFNTPGSNVILTDCGQEVRMSPGDLLVDEFGTTGVEFRGAGEWVAKVSVNGGRFVPVGVFATPDEARGAALAEWLAQ